LTGFKNKTLSLLWRGRRDGFGASTFHRLCDGKPNTLTVIKNTNGFIFGGYTSIPWTSVGYNFKEDNTAFLFSFKNSTETPLKLKVNMPASAVYHGPTYGPSFGSGRDLCVYDLSNTSRFTYMTLHSYEYPDGKSGNEGGNFIVGGSDNHFQTVEIEVFQVL